MSKPIERRTDVLLSVKFTADERQEIDRIMEWLTDNPDDAAAYIVWLEGNAA